MSIYNTEYFQNNKLYLEKNEFLHLPKNSENEPLFIGFNINDDFLVC